MSLNPLVSIITPAFNSERFIEETVQSVIEQTYPYWEHIIVDDGSQDCTVDIIENLKTQDCRIQLIHRKRGPKGRSTSRNIGIENAKGKYIIFLDSDDLLYPHCLEYRVSAMEKKSALNFAVFQMEMFLPSGEIKKELSTLRFNNYLYAFLEFKHAWNVTCPIWKTSFLLENKLFFNEQLSLLEDPLLHTKALLIDDENFDIFDSNLYIDSQYRVDYKPVNIKNQIKSATSFIQIIFPLLQKRMDLKFCLAALKIYHSSLISHYSGQNKEILYNNTKEINIFNNLFHSLQIIDKQTYLKTRLFIFLLEHKLFEKKLVVSCLEKMGYHNFYYFNIKKLV